MRVLFRLLCMAEVPHHRYQVARSQVAERQPGITEILVPDQHAHPKGKPGDGRQFAGALGVVSRTKGKSEGGFVFDSGMPARKSIFLLGPL